MFDTKKTELPSPTESTTDPLSGKRISRKDLEVKMRKQVNSYFGEKIKLELEKRQQLKEQQIAKWQAEAR